jgi:hypothetical protein
MLKKTRWLMLFAGQKTPDSHIVIIKRSRWRKSAFKLNARWKISGNTKKFKWKIM